MKFLILAAISVSIVLVSLGFIYVVSKVGYWLESKIGFTWAFIIVASLVIFSILVTVSVSPEVLK